MVGIAIGTYLNTLQNGLVLDDIPAVVRNIDVRPSGHVWRLFTADFWGTPLRSDESHKSYRPLTVLTFRLNEGLHGLDPAGFHAVNVLLHAFNTLLFYSVRGPIALAGLGMLCKEQCVTVLVVLAAAQCSGPVRWRRGNSAAFLVAFACLAGLRLGLAGGRPVFSKEDNPAAHSPFPVRQLSHVYLAALHLWRALCPAILACDWSGGSVPLVDSLWDSRAAVSLAALVAFLGGLARSQPFLLALSVVPFLPASNLVSPVGFVVAERVLYLPSIGLCLLVARGWANILSR
ncbi:TMTC3 [Cordylochernes scorpioides]|uniref:TMTC3 n=1 Tax=Cordylochernes scorpioides TaxID=51811 RepID=A0ABY6KBX4_9ARAC|nr:TMTC3 [Cordylochernes scorpioides]